MYYKVKGFLIEKIQLYLDNKNSNIKILGNLNNNTTYQHEIELHLELPRDRKHGHFATTIAFSLAKILKNNPKLIADEISSFLLDCAKDFTIFDFVQNINGYINLHISSSFICSEISYALNNTKHNIDKYTAISLPNLNQHRILLEYVSANPTGPLHIGHARGAIFGNVLQKLGKYLGYDIYGEYYVNDAGSQIETCAISVYLEIAKKYDICVDEKYRNSSLYLGEYISDLVEPLVANFGIQFFQNFSDDSMDTLADFVKNLMLDEIKSNLALLDIYFDNFVSEKALYARWDSTLQKLKDNGAIEERNGALWLKSTLHGDEKDRVLVRENGMPTYMAGDVIYHEDKFLRNFDHYMSILGADHHGYVARIKASMEFLGFDSNKMETLFAQMVSLLKNGEPYKMSKRAGNFILLKDMVNDLGADNIKFIFLSKSLGVHLEFDIEDLNRQDSSNPIFYINYANARIHTLIEKSKFSKDDIMQTDIDSSVFNTQEKFYTDMLELALQSLDMFHVLRRSYENRELHKICEYLRSLAKSLHTFYTEYRILDTPHEKLILKIFLLVSKTFSIGFDILGISIKTKM